MKVTERYSQRHGGAFDRGAADSYYGRGRDPHYFEGATYSTPRVSQAGMTAEEIEAYNAGYDWNEEMGDKKIW